MSAEKGSSKADTLVKVVLVFFISLLSFSVGTFVGKQVSDSDHRRMALEGDTKADRGVASVDGKEVEGGDKITEKEIENLTEEFVTKEKVATGETMQAEEAKPETAPAKAEKEASGYKTYSRGKSADAKPVAAAAPAAKASVADGVHKAADKVAKGEAPTDGMKEERKPASSLPSVAASAVGKYTVQVASYAAETEAKNHAADLKGKGWNAFYFAAAVAGKTWYRVSVGLFNNMKTANDFRAQFMKEANTKSAYVQKVIQ